MAINELFPNATVKQVIFQIRFPNLFYLESRMGDFQVKIMKDFPKSRLGIVRGIVFAEGQNLAALGEKGADAGQEVTRIWTFESETGVELNVKPDSLDLSSKVHKTYSNPTGATRFRDSIQRAVDAFLAVAPVPMLTRIGLRYVDDCPVPDGGDAGYRGFYNTSFDLDKFSLPDAEELTHAARVRRGDYFARVVESYRASPGSPPKLTLDFDVYKTDIEAKQYLTVTDRLHDIVVTEFERYLKPPMYEYLRKVKS